ncbi:Carbohydrate esterase 4 protein [Tulasnella sp. 418]|nr:Carbohydrate esterase 4 protein [Tulasnella sp. 418]
MKFFTIFSALLSFALAVSAAPAAHHHPHTRAPMAQVYSKCTKAKTVALTFDDGPYYYMYDISKTLIANGAKGTFFVNGNNWMCIYDENGKRVKYLYDKGHQIASHLWSHPHINTLTWDQMHDEMWKVELAMKRITGATPAFVRPPYGEYNDLFREAAYIRKQSLALWDFDSGDSTGSSAASSKAAYKAKIDQNPSTLLALNHETYSSTAFDVLPYVIDLLKTKGYQMVTLAECLGVPAYASVGAPEAPTSDWHC